jgi:hypothetical protein
VEVDHDLRFVDHYVLSDTRFSISIAEAVRGGNPPVPDAAGRTAVLGGTAARWYRLGA